MLKFLLLIALGLIVWRLWQPGRESGRKTPPPASGAAPVVPERMVRCAHCGVHLPESDALADGGVHYCNAAHRDAAKRARG